jgi:hypothetical protein
LVEEGASEEEALLPGNHDYSWSTSSFVVVGWSGQPHPPPPMPGVLLVENRGDLDLEQQPSQVEAAVAPFLLPVVVVVVVVQREEVDDVHPSIVVVVVVVAKETEVAVEVRRSSCHPIQKFLPAAIAGPNNNGHHIPNTKD